MKRKIQKEKAIELLKELAEAHGAPGYEDEVRRIFRNALRHGLQTDKTGGIICEKSGSAPVPRIMLAAHLDEVGFVVRSITKGGLIKFMPLGGWWPHTLLAQRVCILTQDGTRVLGVIGAKPPHFLEQNEREKVMAIEEMFIDIGAVDADDVKSRFGIEIGDSIVPESPFAVLHNPDYLLCKAFDDRVGAAVTILALQLLDEVPHPNTVVGVGTTQEEVGMRGARTAVFSVNPDAAIVLEGTPADDLPSVAEEERQGALGKGVQIRLMDPSAIMNREFARYAIKIAEEKSIPHQVAIRKSGGTDARAIQLHAAGVPAMVLGVPARYIHTHNSIVHVGDVLSTLQLVLQLLETLDDARVKSFTAFMG